MAMMKEEDIQTADDLLSYILEFQDVIYVREQVNGKWGSFSLEELPDDLRQNHVNRFLDEGRIPFRLKRDAEQSGD